MLGLPKVATVSDHAFDDMILRKQDILKKQTAQHFCTYRMYTERQGQLYTVFFTVFYAQHTTDIHNKRNFDVESVTVLRFVQSAHSDSSGYK